MIELEKLVDERGFFARAWCKNEFEAHGLNSPPVQANIAFSKKTGRLRGMHYQLVPDEEAKLIRCIRGGAIHDVIIDLRPESARYKQWVGVELSANNHKMLYVPERFAHGYQTLTDNTEVFYEVSQVYASGSERGVRWDDPAFGIEWRVHDSLMISDKDRRWPDYLGVMKE